MVATITFKLRSSNHVGIIDVPQRVISCREIKEAIAEKLSGSPEEIDIFVSGSSDYLHPEEELPAYTVVEVVRHIASGRPPPKRERETTTTTTTTTTGTTGGTTTSASSSNAAGRILSRRGKKEEEEAAPLTEEERLAQLSEAVAVETGIDEVGSWRMRQMRNRPMGGPGGNREDSFRPPPPGYICHNCGKKGHLIQHCPGAKGPRGLKLLSLPTGIPETMLVECTMDDPAAKFVTRDGRLVKRRLDNASFTGVVTTVTDVVDVVKENNGEDERNEKKEGEEETANTTTNNNTTATQTKLLCGWDKVLAKNAMKTPCCGTLLCGSCFTEKVEEMISCDDPDVDPLLCPGCSKPLSVPDVTEAVEERKLIEALLAGK
ncbi:putative nucleic acid binding protein [Trypanosoma theileri]|uniref:Putative nucleic acid binding protein n=1 Tax=Trypanosoma theileri TaxID=67003 RepID=A0A1X0P6U9_9TRYP|nr:putative nucleic acid binding protein [Trypanosoma theileri]ORC92160.1 putative nucleic acid binding protein [Trypanosoma theileri]